MTIDSSDARVVRMCCRTRQQTHPCPQSDIQKMMMTLSNGNIFRFTGRFVKGIHRSPVKSSGYRWIPLAKASDPELWCFLWCAHEQTAKEVVAAPVVWEIREKIQWQWYGWWRLDDKDLRHLNYKYLLDLKFIVVIRMTESLIHLTWI